MADDTTKTFNQTRYAAYKKRHGVPYNIENYKKGMRSPRTRANRLFNGAKVRSKKKGLEFSITPEWVEQRVLAGVCEVSGLPFSFLDERAPFAPSLDRKDPTLGYTPDNTQVVVWAYNTAKGPFSHEDVLTLAEALCKATHAKS